MTIINIDTPIALLTVGQLMELMNSSLTQNAVEVVSNSKKYVYGIAGIKKLFNVSHATAQRYKDTILKDAVSQNGRKIIIDAEKAMELFNFKNGGRK